MARTEFVLNRPYDLLIFDWDGTLSDSAQLIVDSMQGAIAALGLPPRQDQQIRELIGLSLSDGMARLYPEAEPGEVLRLLEGYRQQWLGPAGGGANEAPLFDGAQRCLERLHGDGYWLSVATGKSRPGLNRSLRHHAELRPLFMVTKTADETASKPDPLMLREILAELQVPAERALMIGDTEYDAAMAAAIGMPALGVACGVHEAGRIRRAGALAVIDSVHSLPDWLRG
ncbi:HAD family hydrolase [Stagnimonas aquatica]|uniref:HAD family hydrolase n=1 Tax=Stagnimonas aquatica TaxID=2689987 RepID=A0A3N0V9A9_9GAMM|nr:HAD family hydrolase [Stagnimonas aquatica]